MKNDDQLLSELKAQLDSDDRLKAWLIGGLPLPHKTILATTDKKLVRYRKTLTGFSFEAVPYAQISSINAGKGLFGHSVTALGANNFIRLGAASSTTTGGSKSSSPSSGRKYQPSKTRTGTAKI